MRGAVVGLLVATAFILSGCQYLLGGVMGAPGHPARRVVRSGRLRLVRPGRVRLVRPERPRVLDAAADGDVLEGVGQRHHRRQDDGAGKLNGTAGIYPDLGTNVSWTDGAGMYLQFFNDPVSGLSDGFVVLDRIADNKHATIADPSVCKVALTKSDPQGLSGSATCTGARWADAISSPLGPNLIDGEPAFDAKITFEATP